MFVEIFPYGARRRRVEKIWQAGGAAKGGRGRVRSSTSPSSSSSASLPSQPNGPQFAQEKRDRGKGGGGESVRSGREGAEKPTYSSRRRNHFLMKSIFFPPNGIQIQIMLKTFYSTKSYFLWPPTCTSSSPYLQHF